MKKEGIYLALVFLVVLLIIAPVQAGPLINPGIYSTDDSGDNNVTTKFWKEKFLGGGPGQIGNVLMAQGKGFMLQNVVLAEESEPCQGTCGLDIYHPCYSMQWQYKTVYRGGFLRLNSKGPWLKKGKLNAAGLEATNYSYVDLDGNLHFCLVMSGPFQNAKDYSFDVIAKFDGTSDNYEVKYDEESDNPTFQRGYGFDAIIEIVKPIIPR